MDLSDLLQGQSEPMHGDEVDTSLLLYIAPELVVTVAAALKRQQEMAVATVAFTNTAPTSPSPRRAAAAPRPKQPRSGCLLRRAAGSRVRPGREQRRRRPERPRIIDRRNSNRRRQPIPPGVIGSGIDRPVFVPLVGLQRGVARIDDDQLGVHAIAYHALQHRGLSVVGLQGEDEGSVSVSMHDYVFSMNTTSTAPTAAKTSSGAFSML